MGGYKVVYMDSITKFGIVLAGRQLQEHPELWVQAYIQRCKTYIKRNLIDV